MALSESAQVASRHYISSELIWLALHNARQCRQLETDLIGEKEVDIEHRTCAMASVLGAVNFLEALVNEVFQDAGDERGGGVGPNH